MPKKRMFGSMLVCLLALGLTVMSCDGGGGGGEEALLKVTHVKGFQGILSDGSLMEIEVTNAPAVINDGNHSFTLYINGSKAGTGTLTISNGSITAIINTDTSLTYSGGVRYGGYSVNLRTADERVWVHWVVYYHGTMDDFKAYAQQHNNDAYSMYIHRPSPNDQGYYYDGPYNREYDTVENIYDRACQDHPEDPPPISTLNQAIRVLNDHKSTGVGAYVSRGNLIAYYFTR